MTLLLRDELIFAGHHALAVWFDYLADFSV